MAGPRLHVACLLVALLQPALLLEFQRGAVERLPAEAIENVERDSEPQELAQLVRAGSSSFGTRRLPLREAVEHKLSTRQRAEVRIPLRDAVESRPSPDVSRFTRPFSGIPYDPAALPPSNYYTNQNFRQSVVNDQTETFEIRGSEDGVADPRLRPTRVVCYLQSWAAHRRQPMRFTTSDLDPFSCTHLVYAFASLDPHSLRIVPQDEEFDIVKGGYRAAMALKIQNPGLKVMISLGGWIEGARRYSQMASSAQSRREFIRSASVFLEQHGFDGLDLHWEYPAAREMGGRPEDKANFALLAEALSEVFAQRGWLLSAAVSPSRFRIEDGYDVPMLSRFLDFINVKTYDFHMEKDNVADNPAPLFRREHDRGLGVFFNVDYAMRYWLKKGAPSNKLVMGVPFFGRSFTLKNEANSLPSAPVTGPGKEGRYTFEKGKMAYFEICEQLLAIGPQDGQGPWRHEADEIGSPFMVRGDQWVGFDDPSSLDVKMDYVRKHQLGGAVVWSVDMDDFQGVCGQKSPLLRAVREGLELRENEVSIPDNGLVIAPIIAEEPPMEQPVVQPPIEQRPPMLPIPPPPVIMVPTPGTEVSLGPGHGCQGKGFIGDPTNCRVYYRCEWGRKTTYVCPEGLHYDAKLHLCNWPARAGCEQTIIVPEKFVMTPLQQVLYKMQIPYLRQPPQLIRQSPANQPLRKNAGTACTKDFEKHQSSCSKYYRCVHGRRQEYSCATGLHFNEAMSICDWPSNVNCDGDNFISGPGVDNVVTSAPEPVTQAPAVYPTPDIVPINIPTTSRPEQPIYPVAPGTDVATPCTGSCLMVCYFTNWAWYRPGTGKYLPEDIDPSLCTHIVYGFAVLDYENLIIKMHDSWADIDNRFYERVTALKKIGKKVLIAIGGWNDSAGDKYSRLVNNPAARTRFIKHVVEFIEKHNFDGLDLDWEYPKCWQVNCDKGPDSDKQAFADFIRELREAFDPKSLLLTAAVSPSKSVVDAGYDVPAVGKYLHYVSIMTYDFHGHWDKKTGHVAPLYFHPEDDFYYFNANFSINYWNQLGVPRCNIIMGMPLYGQSFTLSQASTNGLNAPATGPGQAGEFTRAAGFLSYYEICDRVNNRGYTVVKDSEGRMGPYAVKDRDWVSYDDIETLKEKARFITRMGLGGGMIWALDLDDFRGTCGQGKYPLLTAINQAMCKGSPDSIKPVMPPGGIPIQPVQPIQPVMPIQPVQPVQPEAPPFMPDEIPMKPKPKPTPQYPEPTLPSYPEQGAVNPPAVIHPIAGQPGTAVATCDGKSAPCGSYKVVCYFTNWAWYRQGVGKYLPSDIDASLCTHIVYGFAVLDGGRLEIKPHDTWADFDNKFYEKVVAYRAKGVKVLLAIGGWNDSAGDKYSRLVNNPAARSKFISHVKEFIKTYNFDGLDLDWEYPVCWQVDCKKGPASDKEAFADFVRELRVAFNDNGGQEPLLLTAAVSPSKYVVDAGYSVASIARDLDWIAVMTYDYHGQWDKITGHVAPMYPHPDDVDATFNANFSIHYWIDQGAPPCKIVMGMPMYGQSFSLADNNKNGLNQATYGGGEAGEATRARGFLAYYEICKFIKERGWKVVQDPYGSMGPYAYLRDQWVSFDDQAMIARKTNLVKELGLAGAMIWALDLDDFRNECNCEPHPLLKTINRGLCRLNTPAPDCSLSAPGFPSSDTVKPRPPSVIPTLPDDMRFEEGISQEATPCGMSSELMPHKTNCNHYYQCVNGVALERNCPPGTVFIPQKQNCGWSTPDMVNCGAGSVEKPPSQKPEVIPAPVQPYPPPAPAPVQPTPAPVQPPPQSTPAPSWPPIDQGGVKQCSDQFQPSGGDAKVICYFTNWAIYRPGVGKYGAGDIDLNLCTHVLYGFAVLDGSTLTIKSHDPWADFDDGLALYSKVSSLRAKGIKVLLALGGWNDSLGDKYSRLVSSPGSRSRFIKQAVEFIAKYNFDGLDLDWEYPKCWQVDCNKGPDSDKENFSALVKELSAEFKPKGLLLSAAVSPSKAVIDAGYDVPVLSQYLDWISVMTYDYHGQWDKMTGHVAPFKVHENDTNVYFNAEFTLNYYKKKGADPKKLIMGIPLYAQSFTLIDQSNTGLDSKSSGPGLAGEFTRAAGFVAFYEVCYNIKHQGWKVQRDPTGAMGPYAYKGNQWMSYDDVDMVREKMGFVRSNGLGGAMIWALDLDDFTNRCGCGKYPLLRTINEELRGQGCKLANCT